MILPKVSQQVQLTLLYGPHAGAYSTYVEDVTAQWVALVRPLRGGQLVPLAVGDSVRVDYALPNGAGVAYQTTVRGLEVRGLPVMLVGVPADQAAAKSQQRDYVRLDINLSVSYTVRSFPGRSTSPSGPLPARTRDISGNGTSLMCQWPYQPGTQLEITFTLDNQSATVVGEVVRQGTRSSTFEYPTGIRFVNIEERTRETIIRFIFSQQRERRSKGLM